MNKTSTALKTEKEIRKKIYQIESSRGPRITSTTLRPRSFPSYETTVHVFFNWVVPISPKVQNSIVEKFLEIPHKDLLSLIGNVYNILQIYFQQWNCSESFLV